MLRTALVALFLLTSTCAHAGKSDFSHETVKFDPAKFEKQRSAIEKEITRGERYAEISDQDKRDVLEALEAMSGLLEGKSGIDELNADQRIELFNRQETVNTLLTGAAEDSRLICKRQTKTGSHRQETKCVTVAQARTDRENAENMLRGANRRILPNSN